MQRVDILKVWPQNLHIKNVELITSASEGFGSNLDDLRRIELAESNAIGHCKYTNNLFDKGVYDFFTVAILVTGDNEEGYTLLAGEKYILGIEKTITNETKVTKTELEKLYWKKRRIASRPSH